MYGSLHLTTLPFAVTLAKHLGRDRCNTAVCELDIHVYSCFIICMCSYMW